MDKGKAHLKAAEMFIDKAVAFGIRIIACQKVIHPSLLLKLKRKGILVLQRLGKQMTDSIEKLSGKEQMQKFLWECMKQERLNIRHTLVGFRSYTCIKLEYMFY